MPYNQWQKHQWHVEHIDHQLLKVMHRVNYEWTLGSAFDVTGRLTWISFFPSRFFHFSFRMRSFWLFFSSSLLAVSCCCNKWSHFAVRTVFKSDWREMKNVFKYTRQAVKNGQERIPSRLALLFRARIKTQVMDGPKAVAVAVVATTSLCLWFVDVKFQLSFNVSWSLIHHETVCPPPPTLEPVGNSRT